jgi:hypothetical protein
MSLEIVMSSGFSAKPCASARVLISQVGCHYAVKRHQFVINSLSHWARVGDSRTQAWC